MIENPSQPPSDENLIVQPNISPISDVKKGRSTIFVGLALFGFLLIVLGFVAGYLMTKNAKDELSESANNSQVGAVTNQDEDKLTQDVDQGDNWLSYSVDSPVEYHQSYTIFYPPTWELDTSNLDQGIPTLSLKKNGAVLTITQGPMGGGGCLYPDDKPYDGMVSNYGSYDQINKDNIKWRVAKALDAAEDMAVVCEAHTNGYGALTSIGLIELRMTKYDQALVDEFVEMMKRLELAKVEQSGQATVSGKVCYPSEFIPAGKILAKNVMSKEIVKKDNPLNSVNFSMELEPGNYVFAYLPDKVGGFNGVTYDGFYTKCATTMQNTDCDEVSEHELIQVTVKDGQTYDQVRLCDWYYSETMKPNF